MEFGYIVGRHLLNNGTETSIAGFLKIEKAKDYINHVHCDYMSNGYFYIDTMEGRYILGTERKSEKEKWYAPNEKAYIYDLRNDCVSALDELK